MVIEKIIIVSELVGWQRSACTISCRSLQGGEGRGIACDRGCFVHVVAWNGLGRPWHLATESLGQLLQGVGHTSHHHDSSTMTSRKVWSGESSRPLTPMHLPFVSRYFCKSRRSSWQRVVYTTNFCITMRLPFVSRCFCRSIRVRGRWNTSI